MPQSPSENNKRGQAAANDENVANDERPIATPLTAKSRLKLVDRRHLATRTEREKVDCVDSSLLDWRALLPKHWPVMAPFLAISIILAAAVAWRLPSALEAGVVLLAVLLTGLGKNFAALERRSGLAHWARGALFAISALLPLALISGILSGWIFSGVLTPFWGLPTLISLAAIARCLLHGRIVSMITAQIACWLPVAVMSGSILAIGGMALFAVTLGFIAVYQLRFQKLRDDERQISERVRHRAEDILRDYEETGQGWFWETDRRGQLIYLTDGVARTLNRGIETLLSRPVNDLFDPGEDNREGERTLTFHFSTRSSFNELAVRAASTQEERWWAISGRPVYDSFRNFVGFRGSGTDLTEQRRSQESKSRLANFDSLTGLANRFQMSQLLEKILGSPQIQERECSVFLLDLDRFKIVNDTLGHPVGDALLKQVGQRFERAVGEMGRVGRVGGDEFKLIVPGRVARTKLEHLAQEVIRSLSQPYSIGGQRVVIGASVGIAVCPDDGTDSETLIRNSDLALYAAKDRGRGRSHFYSDDLHSAAEERDELEQDLRDGVAQGSLELYYQPVVAMKTNRINGFEALLRWNHPQKGWLPPEKFIPIAEDTGMIMAIGEWALRTACHQLASWPEEVRCAVNVSPLQFANPNFPAVVTSAISQAGIDPARLELEITESVFLGDNSGTDAMFAALKRIGVKLALDDFGTGYSSLGHLKKAPFDKIKIDQSFLRGAIEKGSRNGAIIASITSLAQVLGMDTTAEGVETLDELDLVRSLGCSHVQGYIYDQARSAQTMTTRIQEGLDAIAQGPRSARLKRNTVLRKVPLENGGQVYNVTIRNINTGGAMVEGLRNVPPGTRFTIALSENFDVSATSRWSEDDRTGVQFDTPLVRNAAGAIIGLTGDQPDSILRKAG